MPDLTMTEKRWHRFRFYPEGWSNFDSIEECKKPAWCWGCQFKHAFCTENGSVTEIIDPKEMPAGRAVQEKANG